ncbi:hypothetical protein ACJ73_04862 [Blastomyces percursus]|uniref:Uncharacterized protein n=1 Tax=Blastomyces percursus TaxID=1658174 RepID=A0A1J9Q5M6_9EURO|nr:hypothetical protein ACJ73_04862 [Blastomyces percursus]
MNFAPYQDESPEIERALSPPLRDTTRSKSPPTQNQRTSPSFPPVGGLPSPSYFANPEGAGGDTGFGRDVEGGRLSLGAFETSLPIRMDFEAMLAYLLLPPAGGVFLLLVEHKSDYVRFHAWQSSMLFTTIFIIHMIFAWSSVISWLLFVCDIALIGFLSMRAYRDGKRERWDSHPNSVLLVVLSLIMTSPFAICLVDSLEHYEVPFFGRLANSFVDDE